jgi:hypothetical protein
VLNEEWNARIWLVIINVTAAKDWDEIQILTNAKTLTNAPKKTNAKTESASMNTAAAAGASLVGAIQALFRTPFRTQPNVLM